MNSLQRTKWNKHTNFSYLNMSGEIHIGDCASSSLFNGTIIEKNEWNDVTLDKSDIEATRILDTTIQNSSFDDSDVHSLWVVSTRFHNVSFRNSNISDCTFINCIFEDCDFYGATFSESQFRECTLNGLELTDSSFLSNEFENCLIKKMCLKNVFYYTYFNDCIFESTILEAYLLGYTYGLTLSNLEQLQFLFMGEPCKKNYKDICIDIATVYEERKMLLNQGILLLIDPNISTEQAIIKCFQCIYRYIQKDCLAKKDALQFLNKIIRKLYDGDKLSPIVLLNLLQAIKSIAMLPLNSALEKASTELLIIKNDLMSFYNHSIERLCSIYTDYSWNQVVTLKIIYESEPDFRLVYLIIEIDDTKEAKVIKTEKGSFIEWISCSEGFLAFIDIFLQIMGITIPIVYNKMKERKLKNKNTTYQPEYLFEVNNTFNVNNISTINTSLLPDITENIVNPIMQKKINTTVKVIINNNFIESANNLGYTNKNVRSIEVINPR